MKELNSNLNRKPDGEQIDKLENEKELGEMLDKGVQLDRKFEQVDKTQSKQKEGKQL